MIVGGITSSFLSMFPVILPSVNTINPALDIYNTSIPVYGLNVAIIWMVFAVLLAGSYFIIQKRILSGKIEDLNHEH